MTKKQLLVAAATRRGIEVNDRLTWKYLRELDLANMTIGFYRETGIGIEALVSAQGTKTLAYIKASPEALSKRQLRAEQTWEDCWVYDLQALLKQWAAERALPQGTELLSLCLADDLEDIGFGAESDAAFEATLLIASSGVKLL